jgi:hypothetical protein
VKILIYLYEHYQNQIYAWEIWNEPNLSENWLRPECQSNNGLCFRNLFINNQDKLFIDLIGAKEYLNMVNITYQKIKSINSNIILLVGSLLATDLGYLNEMYKYGIKDLMDGLSIHPYLHILNQHHKMLKMIDLINVLI